MTNPFERDRKVDKPGIVGARWWHESLADQETKVARRKAIQNILVAGAVIAGFGAMLAMCIKAGSSSDGGTTEPGGGLLGSDQKLDRQTSLQMQQKYGWSFGAMGEPLVFDGEITLPFEPGALRSLETDLAPAQPQLTRYFQSTLFRAPDAVPPDLGKLEAEQSAGFTPLAGAMKPIFTNAMSIAYARGKSLASLFAGVETHAALFVDLPGPEAVAFAAGAAAVLDPVFLFDNWPHPHGVVRAQDTLSAAAYYQPLFAAERKKAGRATRPAMFVLDRNRLAQYTDDATQFDNRYVAKVPTSATELKAIDAAHLLYVAPADKADPYELDDLNDELVLYVKGGVDVRALSLDLFAPDASAPSDGGVEPAVPEYFYGGSRASHHAFFVDYPWAKPAKPATARPTANNGKAYTPAARITTYSTGNPDPAARGKLTPVQFATVPVVVAAATGVVLGARYARNGSWNRTTGGSWGGG